MAPESAPFTFQVLIDGAPLDDAQIEGISARLRELMLQELARIDNRGDFHAEPLPLARGIGGIGGGGGVAGMRINRV